MWTLGDPKMNPETAEYLRLEPTVGCRPSMLPMPDLEGTFRKPRRLVASALSILLKKQMLKM